MLVGRRLYAYLVGIVVRAPAKVVGLEAHYTYRVGRIVSRPRHVCVDVVAQVLPAAVLGVQQRKAVLNGEMAVRLSCTLQGVHKAVTGKLALLHNTLQLGDDVGEVAALVVCPLAPVALLLLVEHRVHPCVCQVSAHRSGNSAQLAAHIGQHQVPQPAAVSLEGVFVSVNVPRRARQQVVVGKVAVVSVAQHRVCVPEEEPPLAIHRVAHYLVRRVVPHHEGRQHHILRTLVDTHKVVRVHIPRQQAVHVEILVYLLGKQGVHPRAQAVVAALFLKPCGYLRACRLHRPDPGEEPLDGRLLLSRCRRLVFRWVAVPRGVVFRVAELQRVVELIVQLRVQVGIDLEVAQFLRVVQELQTAQAFEACAIAKVYRVVTVHLAAALLLIV